MWPTIVKLLEALRPGAPCVTWRAFVSRGVCVHLCIQVCVHEYRGVCLYVQGCVCVDVWGPCLTHVKDSGPQLFCWEAEDSCRHEVVLVEGQTLPRFISQLWLLQAGGSSYSTLGSLSFPICDAAMIRALTWDVP